MALFHSRIHKQYANVDNGDEKYEAIPYRFYEKLSASLTEHLSQVVAIAIEWMRTKNRDYCRKAPDLLHAITDDKFDKLGEILIALYKNKVVTEDMLTEILREYTGILETESVWKVLIINNPNSKDLKKDCIGYFFGTGSTSGADGIALAYEDRRKMFAHWQDNSNHAVKEVGIEGARTFKNAAKKERERMLEEQKLREHDSKNRN